MTQSWTDPHPAAQLCSVGWLPAHAQQRPAATALVCGGLRLSHAELEARVARLAAALRASGVAPGQRVAVLLPNSPTALLAFIAVPRIGAVLVPLSTMLRAEGLASLLEDAEPSLLLASTSLRAEVEAALARASDEPSTADDDLAASSTSAHEASGPAPLTANRNDAARRKPPVLWWCDEDGDDALAERLATADPAAGAPALLDEAAPYNIMYTSGTTGLPKGIVHDHRIRALYGLIFAQRLGIDHRAVVLQTGAIVFNGAFVTLMPALHSGACYVLDRGFDAARALALIESEGVTHAMMVPAQLISLLDHPDFDPHRLRSLRMLLTLGAPMPAARREQWMRLLPGTYHELYGLTEGFVTVLDADDARRKPGSVGCPPPFFQLRIVDEAGRDLPPGENGEILGRGPILMPGYYTGRRAELRALSAQTLQGGWLHTGDIGHVDAEGYLYLVDRKKDMIDSGGVKVYPRDIEEIAARHPAVAEVAVYAIPDPRLGEVPAAAVRLCPHTRIDPETLREWINQRVGAKYQRLRQLQLLDEFPRNAAGKILKRELRAATLATPQGASQP